MDSTLPKDYMFVSVVIAIIIASGGQAIWYIQTALLRLYQILTYPKIFVVILKRLVALLICILKPLTEQIV